MVCCAAAVSEHPVAAHATGEVIGAVLDQLDGEPAPDVALLFATTAHTGALDDVVAAVTEVLRPGVLAGSTAASVAGRDREVEDEPGLSLFAARFDPGTPPAVPVRLQVVASPESEGWAVWGLPAVESGSTLVLLPDPFTFPADRVLDALAEQAPGVTVVGGLASAANGPGGNRLILDGTLHTDGAVGVVLPPAVATTAVVSQGCRPIGEPMVVTRASGTLIEELASEPALTRLLRLIERLDPHERSLAARGLHLGRVVDERKEVFERGDFLIRNVLGGVREQGAIAVGDEVEVGSVVQFQVRDAESADEDLRALLAGRAAAGALLFTCNGRGSHLFGRPDHDAELVSAVAGGAVAGMACAGELGPIGGRPWLHGFTASVLLFEGREGTPG
jgi:small ligand-binding sensory domain FIST